MCFMPTIKIELKKGKERDTLILIKDTVMNAVIDSLQLPKDDRNIRLLEYDEDFFQMKSPYEMLIEISMFTGRTKDTKRKLYHTIVHQLDSAGLIAKEKIFILLNEQIPENWGVKGGVPADEVSLGFNVNV